MFRKPNLASLKNPVAIAAMVLVLAISAALPRGYMIAPSAQHGFEITACPEAHPLARVVAQRQNEEQRKAHAAMGHHGEPSENPPSSSQSGGDCAFAGFSAQALANDARVWDGPVAIVGTPRFQSRRDEAETRPLRLRPPLRGPPLRV